jgi:hypothetical protein
VATDHVRANEKHFGRGSRKNKYLNISLTLRAWRLTGNGAPKATNAFPKSSRFCKILSTTHCYESGEMSISELEIQGLWHALRQPLEDLNPAQG